MEQKSFQEDWELVEAEHGISQPERTSAGGESEATSCNTESTPSNGSSSSSSAGSSSSSDSGGNGGDSHRGAGGRQSMMEGNLITSTPPALASSLHGLPLGGDSSVQDSVQHEQLEPSTPPAQQRASRPYT